MNFFMEVAKLRAARLLWHRVMTQFEPKNPQSLMLRTHCQTSGVSLTEQDPYNNVVRTAVEAMAAVLGGTQSLHTNSFDEALGLPTDFSRPHRPQHPAHPRRGDRRHPRGRSAGRLATTSRRSPTTWPSGPGRSSRRSRRWAGMTKAVESGMPKLRIEESAARRQARVDRGEEVDRRRQPVRARPSAELVDVLDIDNTKVREQQIASSAAGAGRARRRRPASAALDALTEAGARGDGNLLALCHRRRPGPRHRGRDLRRHGGGVRPPPRPRSVASPACTARPTRATRTSPTIRAEVEAFARPRRAAGPACWWSRWARTATTAGPRSSPPPSPTSASTSTSARCSRPRRGGPRRGRERRPRGRRLQPGRRPQDPGAPAHRGAAGRAGAADNVVVVCGGVIPPQDYDFLSAAGVAAVFGPGTNIPEAARRVLALVLDQRDPA